MLRQVPGGAVAEAAGGAEEARDQGIRKLLLAARESIEAALPKLKDGMMIRRSLEYEAKLKAMIEWGRRQSPEPATRPVEEPTTPEDTLREAGISSRRQARYQWRMSSLLAGR